ncbi:MAG: ATP phosphoribosyltransferase regulatory subunit [Gammaproteobacteria bacterium]|nr:ATP phosphoribosyltransferase regulatory subunit [Gammaproteobacteria bacterium]
MSVNDKWMLPEGIDELLPARAAGLETLRRDCLDYLASWGYQLVEPPLLEYLDSLLSGMGQSLDLQTFKLIDQQSGRMLGLRADMTLQAARIDAHRLQRDVPVRLCYCGPVLHTLAEKFAGSRNPFQLGAELYGSADLSADAEIIRVMLGVLQRASLGQVWLELGHVGVFRAVVEAAGLAAATALDVFADLQRKDPSALEAAISDGQVSAELGARLLSLLELNGDASVLARARAQLGDLPDVADALNDLERLVAMIRAFDGGCQIHIDLAEITGYHYYTGPVFSAYIEGQGDAIAKGGRYDNVGAAFGHSRPATGFSTDLKHLTGIVMPPSKAAVRIYAPALDAIDDELAQRLSALRAEGAVVIHRLEGSSAQARAMDCSQEIVRRNDSWSIINVIE